MAALLPAMATGVLLLATLTLTSAPPVEPTVEPLVGSTPIGQRIIEFNDENAIYGIPASANLPTSGIDMMNSTIDDVGSITKLDPDFTSEESKQIPMGMFAYHKDFLPLDTMDYLSLLFSALGLVIAAGGGIGGGGILVPVFLIFLKFRPKHAVALSNFTILGVSIANTAFNVQNPDSSNIDWDIIVMMEPTTIAGTIIGSFISKYLPDFVLSVLLVAVLVMLAYRTLDKGIKMFQRESEEERMKGPIMSQDFIEGDRSDDEANESQTLIGGREATEHIDHSTPWGKIVLLAFCFSGCIIITVLKGGGHGSVIGVECGSLSFWFLMFLTIPWVIGFVGIFRYMLMTSQASNKFDSACVRWDAKTTIKYPAICTIAGVFAGLFSVGGGIVMGPLMLEMGVNPVVAAGTAATMILFTTCAACISSQVFGLLEPRYGIACFLLGLICTSCGQSAINAWMKASRRQSPPVLSIGLVMALSTLLVAWEAFEKLRHEDLGTLFQSSSICSQID